MRLQAFLNRISLGSDFGIYEGAASSGDQIGPVLLTGTDLKELNAKKLKEPNIFKENLRWIAQEDKYFFSALFGTPVDK
jgi:YidC/Oxa1 family membrane protein insertase